MARGFEAVESAAVAASIAHGAGLERLRAELSSPILAKGPLDVYLERVRDRDPSTHLPIAKGIVEKVHALSSALDLPWDLELDTTEPLAHLVEHVAALLNSDRA